MPTGGGDHGTAGGTPLVPDPAAIGFRPLREEDLPLLLRWLNSGEAKRWYSKGGRTAEEVAATYLPRIRGERPTDCYLILHAGRPIGLIQTYLLADYPDYAASVGLGHGAAGLDLFIGEEAYLGRGLGAQVLRRFLRGVVFAPGTRTGVATSCVVGPEPANRAAIRAYEKAGFRYLKTVEVPGEDAPEVIMAVSREALPEETPPA